jgi:hypothetical protein
MERVRRFSFNIHNYQDKGYSHERLLNEFISSWKIDYMIVGQEITEENKIPHLQGYIEFSSPTTWEQVMERFKSTIGYVSDLQKSKADAESNFKYCSKSNDYKEYGSRTSKVHIDDISVNVIALMIQGYSLAEIMINNKMYTNYIIRNYPNLTKIYLDLYSSKKINTNDEDLPF